jgi:hypothetical protein
MSRFVVVINGMTYVSPTFYRNGGLAMKEACDALGIKRLFSYIAFPIVARSV